MNRIISEDLQLICDEKIEWDTLSNKNILITGANGILPAYLVETILLLSQNMVISGIKVFALCRNSDKAHERFKDHLNNKNLIFLIQDVSDPIEITEKIDIIIHAASHASPKYYNTDPVGTIEPNILGTINLLKFAKANNISNFLYFSSAEVYSGLKTSTPIHESDCGVIDQLNLRSCYAESKRMGETICNSWFFQHKIPVKIIRPFHTYGPGMSLTDGRVFADFVANIVNNEDIVIKSNGQAKRSYCYITDAVIAYFLVIFRGSIGSAYNVGNPNEEYSVMELAREMLNLFPDKNITIQSLNANETAGFKNSNMNEDRFLPNISKLTNLGWTPRVTVQEGFMRTVLSYK